MSEYLSEQEQIEQIRRLWSAYGRSILTGVFISLVGWFSYHAWFSHKAEQQEIDSASYQSVLDGFLSGSGGVSETEITADSVYAYYTRMIRAASIVNKGDVSAAVQDIVSLEQVANGKDQDVKAMASVRLAKLYYSDGKYDQAVSAIGDASGCFGYRAECFEIKGDVLKKLGRFSDAKQAYGDALSALHDDVEKKKIVEMKMSDLPY